MKTILSTDLFMEIAASMQPVEGMNNYEVTYYDLMVMADGIYVESVNANEYGGVYGNNDLQPLDLRLWNFDLLKVLVESLAEDEDQHIQVGEDFPIEEED